MNWIIAAVVVLVLVSILLAAVAMSGRVSQETDWPGFGRAEDKDKEE